MLIPVRLSGSYPAHPFTSGLENGRSHRCGSKTSGSSHSCGDRPMLYIEMKRSFARASFAPPSMPVPPSGHVTASVAQRMRSGGAGHMRSVSAITFCTSGIFLMSSTVAYLWPEE